MKAIITKYIPATNTKPSRVKATAEGVPPLIMSCNAAMDKLDYDELQDQNMHHVVANALRDRCGWTGGLIGGGLPDQSGYCFVFKPARAALAKAGR